MQNVSDELPLIHGKEQKSISLLIEKKYWIWLVILCTLSAAISYVDRTNMGITILPMSREFGWSSSQQVKFWGHSLSAMF